MTSAAAPAPTPLPRLLVCNCQRTMEIDGRRLGAALGQSEPPTVHTELCRSQIGAFEAAIAGGGAVHVACTQEAPLFREVAEEKGRGEAALTFTNIRERAGWCAGRADASAKMAALLAEATHVAKPIGLLPVKTEGVCLVYGAAELALEVAAELSGRLAVTALVTDAAASPPATAAVPVYKGRIRRAQGTLGAFQIEVDGYAPMLPSARRSLEFVLPRDGAKSRCDLILDLSGQSPLFPDAAHRDGYLRADPRSPVAVAKAMLAASDLVGEFEKPRYVALDTAICAHARNEKVGCRKCLDACPTGAIAPAGDHVAIDALVCGGCGSCSARCPTGAVSYSYPERGDLVARLKILLATYVRAGGLRPILLMHDGKHGDGLISTMARQGRGLPANVLPMSLHSVMSLGHEVLSAGLAAGAERVVVLAPPDKAHEMPPLEAEVQLANTFASALGHGGPRVVVNAERDPEAVEAALHGLPALAAAPAGAIVVEGTKRDLARTALAHLRETGAARPERVPLPAGAPYGRIIVDVGGCTLCLSCAGACPTGAISDNPDRPQIAFNESACVQCGICVATCPEKVIRLEPRYDFTPAALSPVVVKGEEPFHCVECGKAFGTKATIDKVVARLKGHAMFADEARLRVIQMCDTCRVVAVANAADDPMRLGDRPRIRTTEDYVAAAAEAKRTGRKPEDFLD